MSASLRQEDLADARWYPLLVDYEKSEIVLVEMTREHYVESNFLDNRIARPNDRGYRFPLNTIAGALADAPTRPLNWIFHTAFCGSTLLSRCLDFPGVSLALREPLVLHQVSLIRRSLPVWYGIDGMAPEQALSFELLNKLLGRPAQAGEVALLKPTDTCINLAIDMLAAAPDSAAILLYSDLESFLLTMLRNDKRREYMHLLMDRACADLQGSPELPARQDVDRMKDSHKAGLLWLSLMRQYQKVLDDDRLQVCSLLDETMYADPEAVIARAAAHFGLDIPEQVLAEQTRQQFNLNAKRGDEAFDAGRRDERKRKQLKSFAREIGEGIDWVNEATAGNPVSAPLPRPL